MLKIRSENAKDVRSNLTPTENPSSDEVQIECVSGEDNFWKYKQILFLYFYWKGTFKKIHRHFTIYRLQIQML